MPTNNNSQEPQHQIEKEVKPILTSSSSIKPIVYESATFEHLKEFNSLKEYINKYLPKFIISWLFISLQKINFIIDYCFNSSLTPLIFKKIYNSFIVKLMSLDNLINILLLDQGIIAFNSNLIKQNNKIGVWCLYFTLDYIANCFNILLQKLIIIPLNLNNSIKDKQNDNNTESNLPHLNELSSTTKSLKKDLQEKVNIDYIQPTKLKANKLIVEPTQNAYKSVSETYETHLNKENNNVPRALYSTGRDLGNTTLKKFNVLVQSQSKEDVDQLKTN
ncbi:hypothetical protein C6P45_005469 [Maudiozyma exigua]|uniref:Uncharacterized protein n=1 Tax=Maudiozyma exigua TaxID=34358 RepID=A0A9P6W8T3_MAUEX|nr:hypothetical protein C6P45_005469 [Kazachstania exigua]